MRKPKYRRHTVRDLGFVEHNGKRLYFPGKYKSPESLQAYAAFVRKHFGHPHIDGRAGGGGSLAVIMQGYLTWAEAHYPPGNRSEFANVDAACSLLLQFVGDDMPATDFGPLKYRQFQSWLAGRKLSRSYVNAVASRARRMFRWAAGEELIPASVYHALVVVPGIRKGRSAAKEPQERKPVAWEHVEATLPELSPTVAAMVRVQWLTGARSQSICLARPEQFDRSAEPWEWKPRHKMEHAQSLTIYIGPQAREILAPFIDAAAPGQYLFRPLHLNGKRAKGYRSFYDSVSYLRAIARAIERVNVQRAESGEQPIPHWTPHQLRHARGTLVRASHGLEAAQATLGHQRLDATQIYAKRQTELARSVAESMG